MHTFLQKKLKTGLAKHSLRSKFFENRPKSKNWTNIAYLWHALRVECLIDAIFTNSLLMHVVGTNGVIF